MCDRNAGHVCTHVTLIEEIRTGQKTVRVAIWNVHGLMKIVMGGGFAGRPPCLPQVRMGKYWVSWETSLSPTQSGPFRYWVSWVSWVTSLSTTQSGPYGCWVSWETSLFITQSGPCGCWISWETSLSTTHSGPCGCWISWETSLSTTESGPYGCWVSWETSLSTTVRTLWVLG